MKEDLFVPTVEHEAPKAAVTEQIIIPPSRLELGKLDNYHPYLPQDQQSRQNLLQWINYPGILKITRISRQLHRQADLPKQQRNIQQMIKWAKILQFNARILASTQAAPVVVSMAISVLRRAAKEDEEIRKVLRDLVNGQPESNLKRAKDQILSKVTSIVTSPMSWPKRTRHTII